jgi:hypothetical protein
MNDFEYQKSKYQIERSLLQKAVRRGDVVLVEKVVQYLIAAGDSAWLRKRLFVIAYEECWPLGLEMDPKNLLASFQKLAISVKNKNAAGLAKLAEELNFRNYSIPGTLSREQRIEIQDIAQALKDPAAFWTLVEGHPQFKAESKRINAARDAVKRASFGGDKAVMYASAYLALNGNIPQVNPAQQTQPVEFPYWVAFDKHTDVGKAAIAKAAEGVGLDMFRGFRLAFYLEGSTCNQISDSPYWAELARWEIYRMDGMKVTQALDYWEKMKPIIIDETKADVEKLIERISNTPKPPETRQLELF